MRIVDHDARKRLHDYNETMKRPTSVRRGINSHPAYVEALSEHIVRRKRRKALRLLRVSDKNVT